jgi:hypothetical protein
MYQQFKQQGRLLEDGAWERCTLFDINFRPTHMTVEELRAGFHDLVRRLYSDDFTKYRRDTFKEKYLRRPMTRPMRMAV